MVNSRARTKHKGAEKSRKYMSLDNQPRFLRITIGSRGEVVVNYLIFVGI